MHPPPTARCIPQVDVTGIEPALYLVCKTLACCLSAHTLRFFSGWGIGDPGMDGRTSFCWLVPAVLEVHAPSRQLTRALPPAPSAPRAFPTASTGAADELGEQVPNSPAPSATRATSRALALVTGDSSHPLSAPSRGKKERNLLIALPCRSATTTRLFTGSGSAP